MIKDYLTSIKRKNSYSLRRNILQIFFLSAIFFTSQSLIAQAIPASDGGTPCSSCAPPGWSLVTGTPDISDQNIAAAVGGGAGNGTAWDLAPLPLPPNGHLDWISLRDLGGSGTEETVSTNMTGLTIGATYELRIYTLTALAVYSPDYNESYSYQIGAGPIVNVNPITQDVWGTNRIRFVATAATE